LLPQQLAQVRTFLRAELALCIARRPLLALMLQQLPQLGAPLGGIGRRRRRVRPAGLRPQRGESHHGKSEGQRLHHAIIPLH
jgi:hypothetical protein